MDYFDYLEKNKNLYLNQQQKNAISHVSGPGLVLSTAGSGKTTVITTRAGKLIYDGILGDGRILTITFSKMAAMEMENRFISLFPDFNHNHTHFSTIHSFSYRIVRDYFSKRKKDINLINSNFDILKKIMTKTYSQNGLYNVGIDEVENLASKVSYVKNMKIKPEDFQKSDLGIKDFETIFLEYEKYKKSIDSIDFDDMLIYCEKILKQYKEITKKFKSFYKFIQLDEAQDTSLIQKDIIDLISNGNLFIVGDDDQSIYSFRGSSPEILLDFKNTNKNGYIYPLDMNYRCDGYIVDEARNLIEKNMKRYSKNIIAKNEKKQKIVVKSFLSRRQQAEYIINKIKETPEIETAILYRYNISSIIPAEKLRNENIKFFIKEDRNKFFNSSVLRDILCFFKLSLNPRDIDSFLNIYYKCQTYFTKEMSIHVSKGHGTIYDSLNKFPSLDKFKRKNIKDFKWNMNHVSKLSPEKALDYIRYEMGYDDYINRLEKDGRLTFSSMFLNIEIIKEICRNSNTINNFLDNIDFLQDLLKSSKDEKEANITLSSIHSTKGLEFERVFLIDNIFNEFPMEKKNQSDDEYKKYVEEERRIFYVGMTRAKLKLEILYPEMPSLFISELNQNLKKDRMNTIN